MSKYLTVKEATEKWVSEFNSIEHSLIENVMKYCPDDFIEITPITKGDYVCSYSGICGEAENVDYSNEQLDIEGQTFDFSDIYKEQDELPMWGWFWTFNNSLDEDWVRENLVTVAECGFRIYEYQDTGTIYLGIDGAGYNFYDAHWIPLYKARGLQWHSISA